MTNTPDHDPLLNDDGHAPQNADRLSGFLHHNEDAVEKTKRSIRRSSLVKKIRLALPIVAGLIVVVMFVWSDMENVAPPQRKEDVAPQSVGRNELINPRFESEDSSQQPFTITAARAFQKSENLNLVFLEKPLADIALKDKAWLALEADKGEFEQVKQTLVLEHHVRLFHDEGYEMIMDRLDLDILNETAVSTTPVSGQGPVGRIEAQGLMADGKTGVLTFTGPAKLILNQNSSNALGTMP